MGLLDGKVAIVTGAAHGIGRGHALELAAQGASVVVNDLGGSVGGEGASRAADGTVDVIRARGGTAVADYEDVADHAAAGRMVDHAVTEYGRLDILVTNAGIVRDAMISNLGEADWDAVVRVHLKGTYGPCHHAARHWRERAKAGEPVAGRIITTTSGAGLSGNVGQSAYTAAKMGIVGLTLTLSLELARYGVTVNCIAPGGATRISATIPGYGGPKEPEEYESFDPMDPSLSSPIVAWLASDEADHVSGHVLRAVGETLILLEGFRYGPTISNGGQRWDSTTIGQRIATDIFGTRIPGLRPQQGK
jgi:NAD(P)-dependent dehydrogenase (short-subunit alcohol dehydrogenase family)